MRETWESGNSTDPDGEMAGSLVYDILISYRKPVGHLTGFQVLATMNAFYIRSIHAMIHTHSVHQHMLLLEIALAVSKLFSWFYYYTISLLYM